MQIAGRLSPGTRCTTPTPARRLLKNIVVLHRSHVVHPSKGLRSRSALPKDSYEDPPGAVLGLCSFARFALAAAAWGLKHGISKPPRWDTADGAMQVSPRQAQRFERVSASACAVACVRDGSTKQLLWDIKRLVELISSELGWWSCGPRTGRAQYNGDLETAFETSL